MVGLTLVAPTDPSALTDCAKSLAPFHPAARRWFEERLGRPTVEQAAAWPAIREGRHTLIAAPTGSGKTLAAFYAVINDLLVRGLDGRLAAQTCVVYVSPLKALSNDIHRNLEAPLAGIQEELARQGLPPVALTAAVRTGDTPSNERQQMLRNPPHILVTTPESLYVLLTSAGGRAMLRGVERVIVDEIHAVVGDKRGSHLALSLERLAALTEHPLQRIGLSATQKPIDLVARFLVGTPAIIDEQPQCTVIDSGHRRRLDLRVEVPSSPLTAVMSNEVWGEVYERLVQLIQTHRTTLVFVNTRRLSERLAHGLAERLGEEHVTSHHGSMSKEHRHSAEQRLKAGELKVLVATASMELGIDVGSVELVVQIGSCKRIAAFLQRVGRSGHQVGGVSKGIIFPLSREELVECAALLDSVRRGELDRILMPEAPLDVLSQQIVAEVAGREWELTPLYELCRRAYPYRELTRAQFETLVRMLAEGFTTRRGRRGAYLHYDAINGRLRARRGARLAALAGGGAIPDMFEYPVELQPEGVTVGTLNEEYALESLPGDIFTLGTHAWQLVRIEGLKVIVHDAAGKPPTVPFWRGEGPGRSDELSESVSRLRETIEALLEEDPPALTGLTIEAAKLTLSEHRAVRWLIEEVGVTAAAAEQLAAYLWMGKAGLGVMPTRRRLVMERFFDETGDMHLVIHAPYGSRINRAWGLSLRKKFCRQFNFELQAAVNENSLILSLSSSHSFPLEDVWRYLGSKTVRDTLIQAMLDAPLFEIRWRWTATRALAILRCRHGERVPPQIQRMQAEDLIAQVFPDQLACFENIQGERQIPDHPLVNQVIHDCLTEAMDIEGLEALLRDVEAGRLELVAKDLREPSVFAQEIINARPYAFLDDTEFAERRVNAIRNRSWLDPGEARELSRLDPQAIELVRREAWPEARTADDLHDALLTHAFVTEAEGQAAGWVGWFDELVAQGRATRLRVADAVLWIAAERLPWFQAAHPNARCEPPVSLPDALRQSVSAEEGLREIIRGRVQALGPVTVERLAAEAAVAPGAVTQALLALEHEGFVFRGSFTSESAGEEEWCERRLLQRIHRQTIDGLRQSIQPVSVQAFVRFLFARHGLLAEEPPTGPETLRRALELLEGFEAPASAWETDLIPARVAQYDPVWLDVLCMGGRVAWGRFTRPRDADTRKSGGPVKSTPMSLVSRARLPLWQALTATDAPARPLIGAAQAVEAHLRTRGASFFEELTVGTGLLPTQVEAGLAELVSLGLATSDSYAGLRALLTPAANKPSPRRAERRSRGRQAVFGVEQAGRWSLIQPIAPPPEGSSDAARASDAAAARELDAERLEQLAWVYLARWGVVFRSLMEREALAPPWRLLVRVLRRLELRGELRGGRFVAQASGEQFALPETVEQLRAIRQQPPTGRLISLSSIDPLNLLGSLLPGPRLANLAHNRVLFRDGLPLAILDGKHVAYLQEFTTQEQWPLRSALLRCAFPPQLRSYLGRQYQP
jgi:ATP-dependent Lhr-like helicase